VHFVDGGATHIFSLLCLVRVWKKEKGEVQAGEVDFVGHFQIFEAAAAL
jgi:hypothetical protein